MGLPTERIQYEAAMKALLEQLVIEGGGGGGGIDPALIDITNYIKAILDELVPTGEGVAFNLSSAPNVSDPLALLIATFLPSGVKDTIQSAPLNVLFPTAITGDGVHTGDEKIGYVPLPANFLRLSRFRMADWDRDGIITSPDTPLGERQGNAYTRGGVAKPIAVMDWEVVATVMSRVLWYYSIDTSHAIGKLFYIPEQDVVTFLTVNPDLLDSLAWLVASKIMQITGMVNEAKMAQERVNQSYLNL